MMVFASSKKVKILNVDMVDMRVNGRRLNFVNTFRYLGVTLDTELNMNAHIKRI